MAQTPVHIPKHLQSLIAQGEHQQLDFKYAIHDAHKIAITLSAFSNTHGGTLLIGVKDNGSIAGSKMEEDQHVLEHAAYHLCQPIVPLKFQGWKAGDRYVLEVTIQAGKMKPYKALNHEGKWLAYIRNEDQNYLAPSVLMHYWKQNDTDELEKYYHTEKVQILQNALLNTEGYSLNRLSKITHIPRNKINALLAKLMRWDLVEMSFHHGEARFRTKQTTNTHQ